VRRRLGKDECFQHGNQRRRREEYEKYLFRERGKSRANSCRRRTDNRYTGGKDERVKDKLLASSRRHSVEATGGNGSMGWSREKKKWWNKGGGKNWLPNRLLRSSYGTKPTATMFHSCEVKRRYHEERGRKREPRLLRARPLGGSKKTGAVRPPSGACQ